MAMVYSGCAAFIVRERATGYKHMQLLLGLSKKTYWLANAVFDIALAELVVVAYILIMVIKGYRDEVDRNRCLLIVNLLQLGPLAIIWVLYYLNAIPHAYALSFIFSSPTKAFVLSVIFSIVTRYIGFLCRMNKCTKRLL